MTDDRLRQTPRFRLLEQIAFRRLEHSPYLKGF
jgi:hypothetical protein